MSKAVCIKILDSDKYVCNEKWIKENIQKVRTTSETRYEVMKDNYILDELDLINYCLTYHYKIKIPEGYKVTTLYTITLSTANFEPDNRDFSNTSTHGLFSSTDKEFIEKKFKSMCKTRKEGNYKDYNNKRHYCWHTEDYSHNQIIHSYDINETYLIERI